jgi:hypothetical protein
MRIIGWILYILGCLWAYSGAMRIIAGVMEAMAGNSAVHIIGLGFVTLGLAGLAIWGGGKLRARA